MVELVAKRRAFIFCAFARLIAPRSNLAKVVHASWKNRDKTGVIVLESCMFDNRDSLLLEAEIQNFKEAWCMGGFGPNQEQIQKRKIERLLEAGEKFGKEIKKHEYLQLLHNRFRKELRRRIPAIKILKRKS